MNHCYDALLKRLSQTSSDPRRELALMAEYAVGIPADRFLLLQLTDALPLPSEKQERALCALVDRRVGGEPLQYLLGAADFYGRSFVVRPGVLIPRFDTEILIDTALHYLKQGDEILDLCAGTGCIGLTLGAERQVFVTEVEKFDDAFSLLRENAARICPSARLLQADVLTDPIDGTYDMILSNPPYIPSGEISSLGADVRQEPITALDGGEDGLLFYRILIQRFVRLLKEDGVMLFECGIGQAHSIEQMLLSAGLTHPVRVRDYGGVERVVGARKSREVSHV